MRLHVEAEFRHDAAGDLVSTNEPVAATAPRFFLGQTAVGVVRRFRRDVSQVRRRAIEAVQLDPRATMDSPLDSIEFERILSEDAPIERTSAGLAFRFPRALSPSASTRMLHDPADAKLLHPLLAAWASDITTAAPLIALVRDGQAVAVCASVRITTLAHEAGVETAAPFRGRGYARAVVTAWSAAVRARGAEPVYSTTWENTASRSLARSLKLEAVGRDLHIT